MGNCLNVGLGNYGNVDSAGHPGTQGGCAAVRGRLSWVRYGPVGPPGLGLRVDQPGQRLRSSHKAVSEDHLSEVVVTGLGREVRRRIGPSAWAVLEELIAHAKSGEGRPWVIEVGTAQLSQALGLSAEVIRSALRRLVAAGLVEREQLRASKTNRFAGARYRIVGCTGLGPAPRTGIPSVGEPAVGEPVLDEPVADLPVADLPAADLPAADGPHSDTRRNSTRRARRAGQPAAQLYLPGLTPVDHQAESDPEQSQQQHQRHLA